jgi:hypothetical protein
MLQMTGQQMLVARDAMEWLTFEEAMAWYPGWEPQGISLIADLPALRRQIPIPPRRVSP